MSKVITPLTVFCVILCNMVILYMYVYFYDSSLCVSFYICIELFQFTLLYVNSEKRNKLMFNFSVLCRNCKYENSNGTTF